MVGEMKRNWRENPPKTKAEGEQCIVDMHERGLTAVREKFPEIFAGAYVERRGNVIAHVYPDGHEDLYEFGADMVQ